MPGDHFGEDVAQGYDESTADLFESAAVEPVADFLAGLAGHGAALELGNRELCARWDLRLRRLGATNQVTRDNDLLVPAVAPEAVAVVGLLVSPWWRSRLLHDSRTSSWPFLLEVGRRLGLRCYPAMSWSDPLLAWTRKHLVDPVEGQPAEASMDHDAHRLHAMVQGWQAGPWNRPPATQDAAPVRIGNQVKLVTCGRLREGRNKPLRRIGARLGDQLPAGRPP